MKPTIRQATESDLVYVKHSWAKSSYSEWKSVSHHHAHFRTPPQTLYEQLFKRWQSRILAKSTCIVAVNPEDADQLLGYCVYEGETPPVLHYVQVKTDFWRQGIARTLLDSAGINASVTTLYSFGTQLGAKNIPKIWTHVPYYLQPQLEKR